MRWRGNLMEGLSQDGGRAKFAKNLRPHYFINTYRMTTLSAKSVLMNNNFTAGKTVYELIYILE